MKEFNFDLWQELYSLTKQELSQKCKENGIKVNKTDTKYKLVTKLYALLSTNE